MIFDTQFASFPPAEAQTPQACTWRNTKATILHKSISGINAIAYFPSEVLSEKLLVTINYSSQSIENISQNWIKNNLNFLLQYRVL